MSHLCKHHISWKRFLAKENCQQLKLAQQIQIDVLKQECMDIKAEQDCNMEDTVDFANDDANAKIPVWTGELQTHLMI